MINNHNYVFLSTIFGSKIISDKGLWWVVKNVLDLLNTHSFFCVFGTFPPSRSCVPARWKELVVAMVHWRTLGGAWRGRITNLGGFPSEMCGKGGFFYSRV